MSDLILITGATGQLGQEWCRFLDEQEEYRYQAFGSKELDLTQPGQVASVIEELQPVLLVNCAAFTDVDGAENNRDTAFRVNGEAIKHLADSCAENEVPLIHYSTDYVFAGEKSDREIYPAGYPEDAEINPINTYGESKAAGEEYLMDRMDQYLLIRVSWLCGEFGNNFVKTMLRVGRERDRLKVVDDQVGSPSFADETVKISFELFEQGALGTYHVTTQGLLSWYDLAMEIFNEKDINVQVDPVPSEEYPTTAPRPRFSKLSTEKLESEAIIPSDWKEGLWRLLSRL